MTERPVVILTWPEVMTAAHIGIMRRVKALSVGLKGKAGATLESAWDHDCNGALAECAVAKWVGVYWNGTVGDIHLDDVGDLQVRSKLKPDHRLVVRRDDKPDRVYVSVRVELPRFHLDGWMRCQDAWRDEWLETPVGRPPMYFVPNSALRPMSELIFRTLNEEHI